jgi:FtsP/CotA-like multicopper oxidase with cupredoxin domain
VRKLYHLLFTVLVFSLAPAIASAQSFRVQCPNSTITHPSNLNNNDLEPPYNGPTQFSTLAPATASTTGGYVVPASNVNGAIKCQQISGGDGYMTEADGTQTFMFSFGPLSGLADIAAGHPGTQSPGTFNGAPPGTLVRGDPATTDGATSGASPWSVTNPPTSSPLFSWNGAVGLAPEVVDTVNISDAYEGSLPAGGSVALPCPTPTSATPNLVTIYTYSPINIPAGSQVTILGVGTGYDGTFPISCVSNLGVPASTGFTQFAFQYTASVTGLAALTLLQGPTASSPFVSDGHVDPRPIMDIGVMNGNIPAPLMAFDEDDEFFLTLSNVGMIMRPDLFEQHTVHFHGYPNASSFYDGVPDASIAINIGGSLTYYYLAPDAGTYFWHCHITPPEHLQMGMVGQLYVRPRQDRVPPGGDLYTYLQYQNGLALPTGATSIDLRTACHPAADILCSATMPAIKTVAPQGTDLLGNPQRYVYNDGDGSTAYDVTYPLQMHGFDPNFHFVGMTFNPEMFADMKDKYFLLNGRSYPDTVAPGPQATASSDAQLHYSQPMPAIINIPVGGKASLRLVNLSVTEYHTIASLGVPMKVAGWNAKLLRDQAGINTEYYTNSITLGGGESLDVILDASNTSLYPAGSVFYLFTPQLDHLSNDAENFGGLMTEVHICASVSGGNTFGNTCGN